MTIIIIIIISIIDVFDTLLWIKIFNGQRCSLNIYLRTPFTISLNESSFHLRPRKKYSGVSAYR